MATLTQGIVEGWRFLIVPTLSRYRYLLTSLACFGVAVLRAPHIFQYEFFWAENGTFLFKEAVENGYGALFLPIVGHYHLVPRIIASFINLFPIVWAPTILSIGSGICSALILAWFSRPGFRWIVPSDFLRVLFCIVACFVPGSYEVFFNAVALNYLFCFLIVLLFLELGEGRIFRLSMRRIIVISFLWFSAGQGIALIPLIVALFWVSKSYGYLATLPALAVSIFLNVKASLGTGMPLGITSLERTPYALQVFFDNLFLRYLFLPLGGKGFAEMISTSSEWLFWLLSGIGILMYGWLIRDLSSFKRSGVVILTIASLSACWIFVLTAITRVEVAGLTRSVYISWEGRHYLVSSLLGICLYMGLIGHQRWHRLIKFAFVFIIANNYLYEVRFPRQELPPSGWRFKAEKIEEALLLRKQGLLEKEITVEDIDFLPKGWHPFGPSVTIRPLGMVDARKKADLE